MAYVGKKKKKNIVTIEFSEEEALGIVEKIIEKWMSNSIFKVGGASIIEAVKSWRSEKSRVHTFINTVSKNITKSKPNLENVPYTFGLDKVPQNYLVLHALPHVQKVKSPTPVVRSASINDNERRGLYYFGGSVLRYLINQCKSPDHLEQLHTFHVEQTEAPIQADWTSLQSNSGLLYVSEDFFNIMLEMENSAKVVLSPSLRNVNLVKLIQQGIGEDIEEKWEDMWVLNDVTTMSMYDDLVRRFSKVRARAHVAALQRRREVLASSASLRQGLSGKNKKKKTVTDNKN